MKGTWNRLLMVVIAAAVTACTGAAHIAGPAETPAQPTPTNRPSATATPVDPADPKEKDVPGDTVRVRTRRSRKSAEVSPAQQESPSKNP